MISFSCGTLPSGLPYYLIKISSGFKSIVKTERDIVGQIFIYALIWYFVWYYTKENDFTNVSPLLLN